MSAQGVAAEKIKSGYTFLSSPSLQYRPLGTTAHKAVAAIVAIPALLAVVCAVGPHVTGSRLGLIPVGSSAACLQFPYGSCLLVTPGPVHDGDFALARPSDPGRGQSLVVKQMRDGRLVSADDKSASAGFDVVGKVLCCLPTHRALGWLDRPDPAPAVSTPEDASYRMTSAAQGRQLLRAEMDRLKATAVPVEPRATYLKGYTYSGDRLQVCSGRKDARVGFVLADKPVNVVAVSVWYAGAEGIVWLRLGGKKIAAVSSPGGPQLVVLGQPVRCRLAGLVRPKLAAGETGGPSEVKRVQFWIQK